MAKKSIVIKVLLSVLLFGGLLGSNTFVYATNNNTMVSDQKDELAVLIKNIYREAAQGRVLGCDFELGTDKRAIIEKWGTPDFEGDDNTITYSKHQVEFTIACPFDVVDRIIKPIKNKGLIYSKVKEVLGTPDREVRNSKGKIIEASYGLGVSSLTFIFPETGYTRTGVSYDLV